ncbi:hypothetical protein VTN00DRAFT_10103 [Thermoascus crustaceus]|uniref:uncharacterized protein n=1 Tax=Thermoascus crustaceus TaxID=5088 RepID=UPI0037449B0D
MAPAGFGPSAKVRKYGGARYRRDRVSRMLPATSHQSLNPRVTTRRLQQNSLRTPPATSAKSLWSPKIPQNPSGFCDDMSPPREQMEGALGPLSHVSSDSSSSPPLCHKTELNWRLFPV